MHEASDGEGELGWVDEKVAGDGDVRVGDLFRY